MPTPGVSTTPVIPACPECGIVRKSGKLSCCGRGGSWFGDCGTTVTADIGHTWYEGIHACKARQSRAAVAVNVSIITPALEVTADNTVTTTKGITATTGKITHMIEKNMPIQKVPNAADNTRSIKAVRSVSVDKFLATSSARPSMTVREYEKLFYVVIHIAMIYISVR